jgi:Zn-dependent peptidase ImmA (M78 family)
MHRFPSEGMETEANRLAGALLVPRTDIHNELIARRIDLQRLAQLKPIWKVAMQSLL